MIHGGGLFYFIFFSDNYVILNVHRTSWLKKDARDKIVRYPGGRSTAISPNSLHIQITSKNVNNFSQDKKLLPLAHTFLLLLVSRTSTLGVPFLLSVLLSGRPIFLLYTRWSTLFISPSGNVLGSKYRGAYSRSLWVYPLTKICTLLG